VPTAGQSVMFPSRETWTCHHHPDGCIENGRLTIRAGAGIVADSDPEKERIETINKAKASRKRCS